LDFSQLLIGIYETKLHALPASAAALIWHTTAVDLHEKKKRELLQWSAQSQEARGGIGNFPRILKLDNTRKPMVSFNLRSLYPGRNSG
jgi:hypothetical protein